MANDLPVWGLGHREHDHRVIPVPVDREPQRDPLPFGPALNLEPVQGGTRQVVPLSDGAIVAIDNGEFGSRLLWVDRAGSRIQPIPSPTGVAAPRRIAQVGSDVLAIGGLCHGDECSAQTIISLISRADGGLDWKLTEKTRLPGCPASAVVDSPGGLLLGTCGALYRATPGGDVTRVAQWPRSLLASAGAKAAARGAEDTYYVSFGHIVARFPGKGDRQPTWMAPAYCSRIVIPERGFCTCSAG